MSEEECKKIFSSDDYNYLSSINKGGLVLINRRIKLTKYKIYDIIFIENKNAVVAKLG